VDLHYSDGIAAARTTIALAGNAAALQRRPALAASAADFTAIAQALLPAASPP